MSASSPHGHPARAVSGRVVLFGATGYTGRLVLDALVARGVEPLLAGRDPVRLGGLSDVTGLPHKVANVLDPSSVAALLEPGDVLVTTVGPFTRYGTAALEAAVTVGAHYLDSTGEGVFIRRVFHRFGPRAEAAGVRLLTAFGYDYVPGNLAGALALTAAQDAGAVPVSVDVGYFLTGPTSGGLSGGTRASAAESLLGERYAYRGGRLVDARPWSEVLRLEAGGRLRPALTVSATEQFALPRLAPTLQDVRVGLGWFGKAATPLAVASRAMAVATVVPGVSWGLREVARRLGGPGSTGGPDEAARAATGSLVVAQVRDGSGRPVAQVELVGPNGYTLTGGLLAWGAATVAAGDAQGERGFGALGPVDAFGLGPLRDACAQLGLVEAEAAG